MAIYAALTDGKSVVTLKTTDGWIPFFNLMSDNMEVFKQYNANDSFKKWLSDMVFALTYNTDEDVYSSSPKIS